MFDNFSPSPPPPPPLTYQEAMNYIDNISSLEAVLLIVTVTIILLKNFFVVFGKLLLKKQSIRLCCN